MKIIVRVICIFASVNLCFVDSLDTCELPNSLDDYCNNPAYTPCGSGTCFGDSTGTWFHADGAYEPGAGYSAHSCILECSCAGRRSKVRTASQWNCWIKTYFLGWPIMTEYCCFRCEKCPEHHEHACTTPNYNEYNSDKSNLCSICPAGKSNSSPGGQGCTNCRAGYTSSAGQACTQCGKDHYSSAGGTCQPCPVGQNTNCLTARTSLNDCQACDAGEYIAVCPGGGSRCVSCPAGKYGQATAVNGLGACQNCPAGTYSQTTGLTAESQCLQCPRGKFGPLGTTGLTRCTDCIAGKYSTAPGYIVAPSLACTFCTPAKYSAAGSYECIDCPAGKTTSAQQENPFSLCEECKIENIPAPNDETCVEMNVYGFVDQNTLHWSGEQQYQDGCQKIEIT